MELLTVKEVMDILKLSQRTIYRYIESGELKAIKFGKEWRIRKTDLENFIDTRFSNH